MTFERATILATALAICSVPMLAQQTTQQTTSTTTTTTSSGYDNTGRPMTGHQLKKQEKADKEQAKADKAERKVVTSHKAHVAAEKQDKADKAAAKANSPY